MSQIQGESRAPRPEAGDGVGADARWLPDGSLIPRLADIPALVQLISRRFLDQGMTVYAAALAYRGLLALVPFALLSLALIGLVGIESSLPRITALLLRFRGERGDDGATTDVPLEGLLSVSVIVGAWSMATGARLFMRALNTTYGVEETRTPMQRTISSAVFLPSFAALAIAATALLLVTSRILLTVAQWFGAAPFLTFLGSWLRAPLAMLVLSGAVAAAYRLGSSVKPSRRAVAIGAGIAVLLWVAVSTGFGLAVSTVLDYGSTYGGLGAAVAILVYLHLTAIVLLLGAQVTAVLDDRRKGSGRFPGTADRVSRKRKNSRDPSG